MTDLITRLEEAAEGSRQPQGQAMTDTVRVPREPTEAMLRAASCCLLSCGWEVDGGEVDFRHAYRAMLAASPQGEGLQRRVDLNNGGTLEAGGHVDDLSISGEYISLLRLERMDRGSFWGRIYMKDGHDIVLSVTAPKGKVDVTAEADQGLPASPSPKE